MTISHYPCRLCFIPITDELESLEIHPNWSETTKIFTQKVIDECGIQPWLNQGIIVPCEPTDDFEKNNGFFAYTKAIHVKLFNDQICHRDDESKIFQIYNHDPQCAYLFLFHERCYTAIQKLEKQHY